MTEPDISQQYCVRWNSHLPSLSTAFPQLLNQQRFIDVTLACEGQQVHCHKIVLAACSAWFDSLLAENPCKHPIIILPKDIKFWTVQALVEFMYKGQVNVSQAGLPDLVKTGDLLQIRGLCNTDITSGLAAPTNFQPIENPKKHSNTTCSTEDVDKEATPSKEDQKNTSDKLKSDDELDKIEGDDTELDDQMGMDEAKDQALDYAMANVMVEYEEAARSYLNDSIDYDAIDNQTGRRIRRPESTLQQAAEYVSSGETFQKVSTLFNIPISTIRFYMARKGILPRRKRGRSTLNPMGPNSTTGSSYQSETSLSPFDVSHSITNLNLVNSRSSSPSELPYHLANYKLPEIRPDL